MRYLLTSLFVFFTLVGVANAQQSTQFVPLVGIPFVQGGTPTSIGQYVQAFYLVAISVAAFLAVGRIIFAGVKYMLTDIASSKSQAKQDIRSAIIGLLIVIGAVLILTTINPHLTNVVLNAPAPNVQLQKSVVQLQDKVSILCNTGAGCNIENCPVTQLPQFNPSTGDLIFTCPQWCSEKPNSIYVDNLTISNAVQGNQVTPQCVTPKVQSQTQAQALCNTQSSGCTPVSCSKLDGGIWGVLLLTSCTRNCSLKHGYYVANPPSCIIPNSTTN